MSYHDKAFNAGYSAGWSHTLHGTPAFNPYDESDARDMYRAGFTCGLNNCRVWIESGADGEESTFESLAAYAKGVH